MFRAVLITVVLALPVAAQTNPDEEWNTLPPEGKAQQPPPLPPPPPSSSADAVAPPPRAPLTPDSRVGAGATNMRTAAGVSTRPVLEPNTVSMFGGRSLGTLTRGEMFYLGFPLIGLRLAMGIAERVDVGIGFDSFYGMMNQPLLTFRVNFFRGTNWAMAATLEGGPAFFTQKACSDLRGPRWLTGRTNGTVTPGVVFSYQGDHPRAARLFMQVAYMAAFDSEPCQRDPLGGVPAAIQLGHNGVLRAGAEMPLSAKTSFVFLLGLDVHGRQEHSIVMPVCSVGLVTSI